MVELKYDPSEHIRSLESVIEMLKRQCEEHKAMADFFREAFEMAEKNSELIPYVAYDVN